MDWENKRDFLQKKSKKKKEKVTTISQFSLNFPLRRRCRRQPFTPTRMRENVRSSFTKLKLFHGFCLYRKKREREKEKVFHFFYQKSIFFVIDFLNIFINFLVWFLLLKHALECQWWVKFVINDTWCKKKKQRCGKRENFLSNCETHGRQQ